MDYEIKMGESVGAIRLGYTREEVRRLFPDLKEWVETPYDRIDSVQVVVKDFWKNEPNS